LLEVTGYSWGKPAAGRLGGLPTLRDWQYQTLPLYQLLQDCAFEPAAIEVMSAAFEDVCRTLGLAELSDPLRDMVAKKVIEFAQRGERDQARLAELTLAAFRN
jgi:hypothetical protein